MFIHWIIGLEVSIIIKIDCVHIGLAAEFGFYYKHNSIDSDNLWLKMINNFNSGWINEIVEDLEPYLERLEGAFIEIKVIILLK